MNDNKEYKDKASCFIDMHDCKVQFLPNAKEGKMIFVGDQFVPEDFLQQIGTPAVGNGPVAETAAAYEASLASAASTAAQEGVDDKQRAEALSFLRMKINDEKRLNNYLEYLGRCQDATDLAHVAVSMFRNEEWLLDVEVCKERFINRLKALAPNVTKGNTVSNIRARIKSLL